MTYIHIAAHADYATRMAVADYESADALLDDVAPELTPEPEPDVPITPADDLCAAARAVLDAWGMPDAPEVFLADPSGTAILANLCNAGAKEIDDDLYEHKPTLIRHAVALGADAWADDGVVYIETPLAQVSFHVFDGEDVGLPEANGRVWDGLRLQCVAKELTLCYLIARHTLTERY